MAETHLTSALAESQAINSPPCQALTHLELARLGARRRGPGDVRAAAVHRELAHREARRLCMVSLAVRAGALRGTGTEHGNPLSAREQQVAALIAEGLNRQIAIRPHLSERTVENHISHILDKLGVDNRTRIATRSETHRDS